MARSLEYTVWGTTNEDHARNVLLARVWIDLESPCDDEAKVSFGLDNDLLSEELGLVHKDIERPRLVSSLHQTLSKLHPFSLSLPAISPKQRAMTWMVQRRCHLSDQRPICVLGQSAL